MGVWGLAPKNTVRVIPSRSLENAHLKHKTKVDVIMDHCAEKKT